MNHYLKNTILAATFIGAIVGSTNAYASQEKVLSVIEATDLIWKMNHRDISKLHAIVFPPKQEGEIAVMSLERVPDKISAIRKAISEKIFGKTVVDSVLETFFSANLQEQEVMKIATEGSYGEYISITGLGVLAAIMILPIGFPMLIMHHMQHVTKIEAQRAGLQKNCELNI